MGCCCDGCGEAPLDRSIPGRSAAFQEQQAYCCGCVPTWVCVSVEDTATGSSASVQFDRDCTEVPGDPILYSGVVPLNGEWLNLSFRFRVIDEQCYLCLDYAEESEEEVTPDGGCHLIDATQRAAPNHFCEWMYIDGYPARWTIGTVIIELSATANEAIWDRRIDCKDADGNIVIQEDVLRNYCAGCSCICHGGCLIVRSADRITTVYHMTLSGLIYSTGTDGEPKLEIQNNYGCCELALIDDGDIGITAGQWPAPVAIRDASVGAENPCPNISWNWIVNRLPSPAIYMEFHCNKCNECDSIIDECCIGLIPRVIHATATITGVLMPCSCSGFDLDLTFSDSDREWIGVSNSLFCGNPVTLRMACTGEGWHLSIDADGCVPGTTAIGTGYCEPLSLQFTAEMIGLSCCAPGHIGGVIVQITVTE
jgi:hypothetical protein